MTKRTRERIPQLDRDARASDFEEPQAITQRDVDRNFGGDRVKAVMLQAIENNRPTTHIRLEMETEPQEAYNGRKFGNFEFMSLLIAGAATFEAVRDEKITLPEGVEINGDEVDGKPVVRLTSVEGLKHLIDRILEHRSKRTYTRGDAIKALSISKREISLLKSRNMARSKDFKPAEALIESAETAFAQHSFREDRDKLDWKPVYEMSLQALDMAQTVVQTWLRQRATTMVTQIKNRIDVDVVNKQIEDALAVEDKQTSIGRIWGIIKDLRTSGAEDPAETRQGVGNRPESTGGSRDRDRFQRRDRRF